MKRRAVRFTLSLLMTLLISGKLAADSPASEGPLSGVEASAAVEPVFDEPGNFKPGPLPAAASVVPGILLHGSGHFAAGDRDTALDLLIAELAGLGLFAGGLTALALTGAGEKSSPPAIISSVTGASLFMSSWASDLYGASGGFSGRGAAPSGYIIKTGYMRVQDPLFLYENFAAISAETRISSWRIDLHHSRALDDDNHFTRAAAAWRFFTRGEPASGPESTWLEVVSGGEWRHYGSDYFDLYSFDLALRARYDLSRFSSALRGSFSGASLGLSRGLYDYDIPGYSFGEDVNDTLLMRTEYGIYIGRGRGELIFFYDHRRDTYAGGLRGGFMGHIGIAADLRVTDSFGFSSELNYGTALVMSFGLTLRG